MNALYYYDPDTEEMLPAPVWLPLAAFIGIHTADAWFGGRAWKGNL